MAFNTHMATSASTANEDWEQELASLLNELASVQAELLEVLQEKRELMTRSDLSGAEQLRPRAEQLLERLKACHDRRAGLLEAASQNGPPITTLSKLAARSASEKRGALAKQVKMASHRMKLLQHYSIANWVLAQRTLLHVAQMLEIIATGGRLQPTYGKGQSTLPGGALVDQEA